VEAQPVDFLVDLLHPLVIIRLHAHLLNSLHHQHPLERSAFSSSFVYFTASASGLLLRLPAAIRGVTTAYLPTRR
jgi:hypothetical protein